VRLRVSPPGLEHVGDPGAAWEQAPVGLLRLAPDGRVLAANRTVLEWIGRQAGDVVGSARLADLLSVGGRIYWETHVGPLLAMRGRVEEVAVELRAGDGRLPVLMTAAVSEGGAGRHVDVALSSARERSRYERELLAARTAADAAVSRLHRLQEATSALSAALGTDRVCQALVGAVLRMGAAAATLWLVRADGTLRRHPASTAAVGYRRPDRTPPPIPQPRAATALGGQVVVPLPGRQRRHGMLVVTPSPDAAADALDLDTLTAVGRQAGAALDRAVQHDVTAGVAYELQHALLPEELPEDPRLSLATTYRPAEKALDVGGDWFDAFTPAEGVLALVVGDVVGRGLTAATAMGQLRSAVRAVTEPGVDPAAVLARLDVFVDRLEAAFMATVVYVEVELDSGLVRYACAGHPPPLVVPAGGEPGLLWGGRSTPLGVRVPGNEREVGEARLAPGDRLVLYTDGLVERHDRTIDDGLADLVALSPMLRDDDAQDPLGELVRTLLLTEKGRDDVCVLCARWEPDDGDPRPASGTGW
jgi:hypothetical protein